MYVGGYSGYGQLTEATQRRGGSGDGLAETLRLVGHGPNANRMDMRRAKVSSPGLGSASFSARDPLRDERLRVWLSAFAYGYGMVSMLKLYENINPRPANLFL